MKFELNKKRQRLINKRDKIFLRLSAPSKEFVIKYDNKKYEEYSRISYFYFDEMIKSFTSDTNMTAKIYRDINKIYIILAISYMLRHDIITINIRKLKHKLKKLMTKNYESLLKIYNIVELLDRDYI